MPIDDVAGTAEESSGQGRFGVVLARWLD